MQVIFIDEDERDSSTETNSVDIIIYVEKVSEYVERKYIRRFRRKFTRI